MAFNDRVIFALDVGNARAARDWVSRLEFEVGYFKVGLELFTAEGPPMVAMLRDAGRRCFLDLKFHDIPNTVRGAVQSAPRLGAEIMTVHLSGGMAMLRAAKEASLAEAHALRIAAPKIVGVSVLTSLADEDLPSLGIDGTVSEQILRLADLARASGIDGMVCSPADLSVLRKAVPPDFLLITPGVRPSGTGRGDQARVATPGEAIALGADLLVIGRPISQAADPVLAVRHIVQEMEACHGSRR